MKRISHGFCLVCYIIHFWRFRDNFRRAEGISSKMVFVSTRKLSNKSNEEALANEYSRRHEHSIRKHQPEVDFCIVVPVSRHFPEFGCLDILDAWIRQKYYGFSSNLISFNEHFLLKFNKCKWWPCNSLWTTQPSTTINKTQKTNFFGKGVDSTECGDRFCSLVVKGRLLILFAIFFVKKPHPSIILIACVTSGRTCEHVPLLVFLCYFNRLIS